LRLTAFLRAWMPGRWQGFATALRRRP
jgi:hypothetical protein